MSRISIVIPFSGDDQALETTLVSVLENRPFNCELLVVDWGRYEDPYRIRDEVTFVPCREQASLSEMVNEGCQAARGDVLHYLQCGLSVSADWAEPARDSLDDPNVAWVSPLVTKSNGQEAIAAGVLYGRGGTRRVKRCRPSITARQAAKVKVLGPTLLAGFFRKSVFELLGGFDQVVGETNTDVDLALSLQQLGYAGKFEPSSRLDQVVELPKSTTSWTDGAGAETVFWRHAETLGWRRSMVSHAWTIACETLGLAMNPLRISRLFGRLSALRTAKESVQYRRHLGELALIKEHLDRVASSNARNLENRSLRRAA